jgi:rhodanese-related sulfurtransferase
MNHQVVREALILVVAAVVLGFAYTLLTKQGFFAEDTSKQGQAASPELIPLERAKALFAADSALFIDARHEFEYTKGHIRGAMNIALNEFDIHRARLEDTPKNKLLIIYCDAVECNSSIEVATKLTEAGFTNVKIFFGGWQEWKTNNLPAEK